MKTIKDSWVFAARCPSVLGTVDVCTNFMAENGFYVDEIQSFDDKTNAEFFIRIAFHSESESLDPDQFAKGFQPEAERFDMQWSLKAPDHPERTAILVSKYDHCLNDLLYRHRTGQLLGIEIDLVVLARYMQVMSPEMCEYLDGWAINIHHSLLPGFKGAKPYHQAWEKGIKMVGATVHYINNNLDEGPIITQGIQDVDHTYYPEDLVRVGQDVERVVLAKAVRLHVSRRVFLTGNRTVVMKG